MSVRSGLIMTRSFRLAAATVLSLAAASAMAQTPTTPSLPGSANSKGVRVLKAEEPQVSGVVTPAPAPPAVKPVPGPTPAKVVAPTPAPTPPVKMVSPTPAPAPTPPVKVVSPTPAPNPAPAIQLCARPFPTTDVRWDGVAKIDAVLAQRLKTRQRVVVDLAQPYPERNAPPAGLSRWLSEVEKGGGAVTVKQYCKAARGGLGSWLAQLAESLGGGAVYRPARQYDVVLHSDALDHVVTQVEFVPKTSL